MMAGGPLRIEISLGRQELRLLRGDRTLETCRVSTARNGPGERLGSECTPRGRHSVAEKIGQGCAPGTVFTGRRPTGEVYDPGLRARHPGRDWILTRILRLRGEEPGLNRGGEVDTFDRLIYLHGAPEDVTIGVPGSHGCIRLRNDDIIRLFDQVEVGTPVLISED